MPEHELDTHDAASVEAEKPDEGGGSAVAAMAVDLGGLTFQNLMADLTAALGDDPDKDGDEDYPWVVDIDPEAMTFIYSCDHAYYEQAFEVADGNAKLVGVPRPVKSNTTWTPVTIAGMASAEEDDAFIFEGEIFRSGEYPDKGAFATPGDIIRLASVIRATRIIRDQHHARSPFHKSLQERDEDGRPKYGLIAARAMEAGKWLWGRIRLPKWITAALGEELPVSVGLELDEQGHPIDIGELSLVDEGRVPTAIVRQKLCAAFAAMAGARHSKADMTHIQAVHDHATELGAVCSASGMTLGDGRPDLIILDDAANMAGARHSRADMIDFQSLHDLAVSHGATCAALGAMSAPSQPHDPAGGRKLPKATEKQKNMNPLKKLLALFGVDTSKPEALDEALAKAEDLSEEEKTALRARFAEAPADEAQSGKTTTHTDLDAKVSERFAAMEKQYEEERKRHDAEMAAMRQQFDVRNRETLEAAATDYADKVIGVHAYPVEREDLVANFVLAAEADGEGGKAKFSAEGKLEEGRHLEAFKKGVEKRPRIAAFAGMAIPNANPKDDTKGDGTTPGLMNSPSVKRAQRHKNDGAQFSSQTAEAIGRGVAAALLEAQKDGGKSC